MCRLMRELYPGRDFLDQYNIHVLTSMSILNVNCKFRIKLYRLLYVFSPNAFNFVEVCLILFSYELHRQLCLMGKSHQIFVTYVITNLLTSTYFHFLFLSCSQVLCTAICIEKVWYMLIVNYLLHNCQLCCLKYVHLIASITCPTFMNLITSFRETLEELT